MEEETMMQGHRELFNDINQLGSITVYRTSIAKLVIPNYRPGAPYIRRKHQL